LIASSTPPDYHAWNIARHQRQLFDAHIAINLRAPFFIMQAAVEDMRSRQSPGTIVNIIVFRPRRTALLSPYVAAKAGLVGLTRNAAYAHRFDRIRINGLNIADRD
jgi:NAD(P)-dependent dehydrogenase (short-subunit alcohol dehydrogenase family)